MIYDTIPNSVEGSSFQWFHGVVEDVNDPEEMGRVRVRCIGYHTNDVSLLPVSSLPWATPILPITSASTSRVGNSATGILPGSWVIGFFRDGISAQDPIILGTIPSISTKRTEVGFKDPSGVYPITPAGTTSVKDIPLEATSSYNQSPSFTSKTNFINANGKGIPTAISGTWSAFNIADKVKPTYPKNKVFRSESGHVLEFDDTSGYERITEFHKSGTFREIVSDGSETVVIVGSRYTIIAGNENIKIKGNCNITIDGNLKVKTTGNMDFEATGNIKLKGARIDLND